MFKKYKERKELR